jgi:hypothetical protein
MREIARILLTVMLPPLGRGHPSGRDLIQVAGPVAPARAAWHRGRARTARPGVWYLETGNAVGVGA